MSLQLHYDDETDDRNVIFAGEKGEKSLKSLSVYFLDGTFKSYSKQREEFIRFQKEKYAS